MERPSHLNTRISYPVASRLPLIGLSASVPLVILWGLTQDMVSKAIREFRPMVVSEIVDKPVKPMPPPPPPPLRQVPPLTAEPPQVTLMPDAAPGKMIVTPLQTVAPPAGEAPVTMPDRPPLSIAATHTEPPYPVIAQRLGEEGKVTLRLTVLPSGKVGAAEIVISSGSARLDQAAQSWIVSHWTYRPALLKGAPTASQAMATVEFNLKNQR